MTSTSHLFTPSPPSSDFEYDNPVVPTNELGMTVDEHKAPLTRRSKRQDVKVIRKTREPRKYVSKHFTQAKSDTRKLTSRGKPTVQAAAHNEGPIPKTVDPSVADDVEPKIEAIEEGPGNEIELHPQPQPRMVHGLNIDELSSDSELSDVPSDIGPDPFQTPPLSETDIAFKMKKKSKNPTKSPYFPGTVHRHRQHFLTTLPFPPLDHPTFGLMQERLAHDPFRLLIATIFLNKTPGERAMPIFFELMKQYPTPLDLSKARQEDVTEIIRTLGFQNQRARKCVAMAQAWVDSPPDKSKRFRKLNYPVKGDGRDVKEGEVVDGHDERVAWEISHLPGLGPYSHDSWRMFCRDELKGLATDWLGADAADEFEPEWKRVLPMDKELRAWMTWMWLKEGWVWNKETGQRTKADEELLRLAKYGGVVQETKDDNHLLVKGLDKESILDKVAVEKPAGDFMLE